MQIHHLHLNTKPGVHKNLLGQMRLSPMCTCCNVHVCACAVLSFSRCHNPHRRRRTHTHTTRPPHIIHFPRIRPEKMAKTLEVSCRLSTSSVWILVGCSRGKEKIGTATHSNTCVCVCVWQWRSMVFYSTLHQQLTRTGESAITVCTNNQPSRRFVLININPLSLGLSPCRSPAYCSSLFISIAV